MQLVPPQVAPHEVAVAPRDIVVGVYGAGGFGREIMHSVALQTAAMAGSSRTHAVCFIESHPLTPYVNGYPVVSESEFFSTPCKERYFTIAIGNSAAREKVARACFDRGGRTLTIQSSHSLVFDNNDIGEGTILCAHTTVTANAKIGKFVHLNLYSYVAHDCLVGDFVTFAPNVNCNGNVHIGDHAYIGSGAVIKQGEPGNPLRIGEGAIIGMGAVVTKDVPPHTTVVGNPARLHIRAPVT